MSAALGSQIKRFQETQGSVPGVVFPTATDRREERHLDVYYGAADFAIGVARLVIPTRLPLQGG